MKKSNLITGFIYLIAGVILLLIAIFTNTKLDSLLCGFAGVGIGPGLMIMNNIYIPHLNGDRGKAVALPRVLKNSYAIMILVSQAISKA